MWQSIIFTSSWERRRETKSQKDCCYVNFQTWAPCFFPSTSFLFFSIFGVLPIISLPFFNHFWLWYLFSLFPQLLFSWTFSLKNYFYTHPPLLRLNSSQDLLALYCFVLAAFRKHDKAYRKKVHPLPRASSYINRHPPHPNTLTGCDVHSSLQAPLCHTYSFFYLKFI